MIAGNSVNWRRRAVKRKRNRTNPYFPEMGPISSVLSAVQASVSSKPKGKQTDNYNNNNDDDDNNNEQPQQQQEQQQHIHNI